MLSHLNAICFSILAFLGFAQDPENKQSLHLSPITIAIEQGAYAQCAKLLKRGHQPSVSDFYRAHLMQQLEINAERKKDAEVCITMLKEKLEEQGLLNKKYRVAIKPAQFLAIQLLQKEYDLLKATRNNDITKMASAITQGAEPNTEVNYTKPVDIAIANGHKEALYYLLSIPSIQIEQKDLEKSENMIELLRTNLVTPDNDVDLTHTSTGCVIKETVALQRNLKKAEEIYALLKKHLQQVKRDKKPE